MSFHTGTSFPRGFTALASALLIFICGQARADLVTQTFKSNELTNLDHHYAYAWHLTKNDLGADLCKAASENRLTSFSITFNNLSNWDNKTNVLYLNLLNTVRSSSNITVLPQKSTVPSQGIDNKGTMYSYVDDSNLGSTNVVQENEFLKPHTITDTSKWLTDGSTSANSVSWIGSLWNLNPELGNNPSGWQLWWEEYLAANTAYPDFTSGRNVTLTFNDAATVSKLASYIAAGGDFALGIDSDCHFSDNSISFAITYQVIPEASALLPLVGMLSLGLGRARPRFLRSLAA